MQRATTTSNQNDTGLRYGVALLQWASPGTTLQLKSESKKQTKTLELKIGSLFLNSRTENLKKNTQGCAAVRPIAH